MASLGGYGDPVTRLLSAAGNNDVEGVKEALAHGADVNVCDRGGDTAAHLAARGRCLGVLLTLARWPGVDLRLGNGEGNTPLHLACSAGSGSQPVAVVQDARCAALLVSEEHLAVNAVNGRGDTPLMYVPTRGGGGRGCPAMASPCTCRMGVAASHVVPGVEAWASGCLGMRRDEGVGVGAS